MPKEQNKKNITNKFHYILLAIILITGIIIRLWGLGAKSLWIDEMYSYAFISQKTLFQSYTAMFNDLSPPVYYLVLYFWIKLFGISEFIMRFPGFIASITSIILVYFSAKKLFNKQIALGATILTSLSPSLLYYSQEARPYSLFVLFSIITVYLWINLINKINDNSLDSKIFLKYTVFSLLTILTHYWGLVLVFFQILYIFIFSLTKKINLNLLLKSGSTIFLISGYFFICQYATKSTTQILFNSQIPRVNIYNLNPFSQIFY